MVSAAGVSAVMGLDTEHQELSPPKRDIAVIHGVSIPEKVARMLEKEPGKELTVVGMGSRQ